MTFKEICQRIISKVLHVGFEVTSKLFPEQGRIYVIHDIGEEDSEFVLTPTQFEEFLVNHKNDNFIRLEDLEKAQNFVALTIDDVPEGFYRYGFPLLKKYNIPFTIFVNISLLNTYGYITDKMLVEMSECELSTIGSHGLTHSYFRNLTEQEIKDYFSVSKKKLENICKKDVSLFAFPYGSFYACGYCHKHLLKEFYSHGFGTVSSAITLPSLLPNYFLPRINLTKYKLL